MTPVQVVGEKLGRYRLAFQLASGGMATVYLACAEGAAGFDKVVAIKKIHPHLATHTEYVEMFMDEARIASQIHHSNVCSVTDFGQDNGTYFLVMEYMMGVPLDRLVGALSRREERTARWTAIACHLVMEAAEGLHAAHELRSPDGESMGVVHRDVSPHNLFVGFDGRLRVVDFGVAKAAGKLHQTTTGQAKGKASYMAPEQVKHGQVDRRADVWALGVVLWEMLAMRRLFRRSSPAETVYAVLEGPILNAREFAPDTPPTIAATLARALDRDVNARLPDARTFARAIAEGLESSSMAAVQAAEVGDLIRELFPGEEQRQQQLVGLARQGRGGVAVSAEPSGSDAFSLLSVGDVAPSARRWKRIAASLALAAGVGVGAGLASEAMSDEEAVVEGTAPLAANTEPSANTAPSTNSEPSENSEPPTHTEPLNTEPVANTEPDSVLGAEALDPSVDAENPAEAAEPETNGERPAGNRPAGRRANERATTMRVPDPVDPPEEAATMEAARPGQVAVVVPGGWANVYASSGRFLGTTPLTVSLAAGHHRLQLRFGGQPPAVDVEVDVVAGGTARIVRRAP